MKIELSHEITQESFFFHLRNRKISENLKIEAQEMIETGSKAASVALLLSKKCGKIIVSKDIHNFII